ncbi:MAG: hypothetical protein ACI4MS_07365 [Candidatus Coproplasma sp.]
MGRKAGKLKVKRKRYSYGCQIIKFEKKCFDWVCAGKEVTDVDDGFEVSGNTVKHKHHIVKSIYFKRPYDYKKNFLFGLTEFLSNIVSFLRVTLINILPFAVIATIVGIFLAKEALGMILGIVLGVYGGVFALSFILAGLGYLWRKVFKLTEKTDEIQESNGYLKWSEYEDDNSTDYSYV